MGTHLSMVGGYLIGGVLVIIGVILRLINRKWLTGKKTLRSRDISGNVIVGQVSGVVTQTSSSQAHIASTPSDGVAKAHLIVTIVGLVVAAAQLAYDVAK